MGSARAYSTPLHCAPTMAWKGADAAENAIGKCRGAMQRSGISPGAPKCPLSSPKQNFCRGESYPWKDS
jgi:hypothetical protein